MSTDQNNCKAVETEECIDDLAVQEPAPAVHSRWLTTANRLLRLYVANANHSDNVVEVFTYVMTVYAPVWFHIKIKVGVHGRIATYLETNTVF